MKFSFVWVVLIGFSPALVRAAVEIVSPRDGALVALLPPEQKEVMNLPSYEERLSVLRADAKGTRRLQGTNLWRKSLPLKLKWKVTAGDKGPWLIRIGKRPDLSDARTEVADLHLKPGADGLVDYELPRANLELGKRYYWSVAANASCRKWGHIGTCCICERPMKPVDSAVAEFVTEEMAPRWIEIEGKVGNIRDFGGRMTRFGKRVRQGRLYRGQGLNENSVTGERGRNRLTVEDVAYLTRTLGIRTDLDLRSKGEISGMEESPLGPSVNYLWHSFASYAGLFKRDPSDMMTPDALRTTAETFRVFCDERNYPIYFHCIGGADRTGALAYILGGVLGVDRHELETDWEATFYPVLPELEPRYSGSNYWRQKKHFDEGFSRYGAPNGSWNDRIVLYLKDCGVTDEEISKFRRLMLED